MAGLRNLATPALGLLSWGLALAASAQSISKLPMLQTVRGSEMSLQWETDSDPNGTAHEIDWGLASTAENTSPSSATLALDATHFVHRVTLTGLQPETQYVYRVRSGAASSAQFSFRTAPAADTSYKMAWLADTQGGVDVPAVLGQLFSHAADFVVFAGDSVNNGALFSHWDPQWWVPWSDAGSMGQTTPVLVARGNHDGESPEAYAYHWLPGNGTYYAETVGRVRYVLVDSNTSQRTAAQTAWLAQELASPEAQDADFLIVVFHIPPFTNLWCTPTWNGDAWVRSNWVPLFEQHGVDLVVNGHAHAYERGELNGVVYAIVGGAGSILDTEVPPDPWPWIDVALSVHHFVIMDVDPGELRWRAYDKTGALIDSFDLSATAGVPALPGEGWWRLLLAALLLGAPVVAARATRGRSGGFPRPSGRA